MSSFDPKDRYLRIRVWTRKYPKQIIKKRLFKKTQIKEHQSDLCCQHDIKHKTIKKTPYQDERISDGWK